MASEKDDVLLDDPTLSDGTYALSLTRETQEWLECLAGKDLNRLNPIKVVPTELLKEDLRNKGNASDFERIREIVIKCPLAEVLVILEGDRFLVCLNEDSKMGYLQAEEDALLRLIDKNTPFSYRPPQPGPWDSIGSERDIEGAWVRDAGPKIRLQVRRAVSRPATASECFADRNMTDTKDGYVSCEPFSTGAHPLPQVRLMDRAVQAVPTVKEGDSQTELKHPKNIAIEYEARVFSEEEVAELWKSPEMKNFLKKAEGIMSEVSQMPDIMGALRPEVESFYRRDEVVVVEETRLVHRMFFSDLVFTRGMRVTNMSWHPTVAGVVALAAMPNTSYESYLDDLSRRLTMPNVLTVWSTRHPFFPQLLLRVCDDVTCLEWHPSEPGTLVGGCMNGQLVVWDLSEHVGKLRRGESTWNHHTFLYSKKDRLHMQEDFIPLMHWSAESDKDESHTGAVESVQWLPKTVWFSHDSAYPKRNQNPGDVQLISCDGDSYVLIWALRKTTTDSMSMEGGGEMGGGAGGPGEEGHAARVKSTGAGWTKVKLQSALPASVTASGKYSPAVGKYQPLDKNWKPVHKIKFLKPARPGMPQMRAHSHGGGGHSRDDEDLFRVLITSMCVVDHPEMQASMGRKDSSPFGLAPPGEKRKKKGGAVDFKGKKGEKSRSRSRSSSGGSSGEDNKKRKARGSRGSYGSDSEDESGDDGGEGGGGGGRRRREVDPAQFALPTDLIAGTMFGSVFHADLTKVKVDVETNDLTCKVDWETAIHDGPVRMMSRSPHLPKLLLTVGGYSWAVWKEGAASSPLVFHYVDSPYMFTGSAWSLAQPDVIFFSDESGTLQVWQINGRKSEPFQTQDISGRAINAICPYVREDESSGEPVHYMSVADETGTLHLLELPLHLKETSAEKMDDLHLFVDEELRKKAERRKLQEMRDDQTAQPKLDKEDVAAAERHVSWGDDKAYLTNYFRREKLVMENAYGPDWKRYLKYPDLPRKKYHVEVRPRDSSEERRKQKEAMKIKKKKGGSIFRKY